MSPNPEVSGGTPPSDTAQELAALHAELLRMRAEAARASKMTAVVFVILVGGISAYLYGLVYRPLKNLLTPETIVQFSFDQVNGTLASYSAPAIDSPALPKWAAEQLKAKAPSIVNEQLKPHLQKLRAELPGYRRELIGKFETQAPKLFDEALAKFSEDFLPQTRELFVSNVVQQTDPLVTTVAQELDTTVVDVLVEHEANLQDLRPENYARLKQDVEATFERQLGRHLDPIFKGVEEGIETTRKKVADLAFKAQAGKLQREEKLEIRLVQLVQTLFKDRELRNEAELKEMFAPVLPKEEQ